MYTYIYICSLCYIENLYPTALTQLFYLWYADIKNKDINAVIKAKERNLEWLLGGLSYNIFH